ncbi:hypothetical protein HZQ75_10925 [Elizabethkingia anophelis]|uniref:DUF4136 domain-containing protein n=1 Tax=Elizabethkingia anophelis R26 TaxID=1246994 RepID=A0ABN5BMP4_9FLAO|nr:hypothetical protein [Elizabethkingia anophelis]ATC34768.1 hypothetical protein BAZ09_000555 [Elizabethkingia anophelis R26]ATC38410.1 hypothetical protein EAAG1_000555 [Elizabethkingia anophelis Ag1]ATC42090.1 hypothetical protein CMV41_00555 [Elizabethkingia anophelis]ATC45766.1 hypothetical protein CMV40_00555 [Elizabethkingia anophelis]ELR78587.1 hypothetical protein D505_14892 [Elizabethkingia anophelis R26]
MVLILLIKKGMLRICSYISLTFFLFTFSCTSYSKYASYNSIPKKSEFYSTGYYYRYTNEFLRITMLMYGDFVYAQNIQQYEKMIKDKSVTNKIPFKSRKKLLYALTTYHNNATAFEYFLDISIGKKKSYPNGYYKKTIKCNKNDEVTLTISENISRDEAQFLINNFKCIE